MTFIHLLKHIADRDNISYLIRDQIKRVLMMVKSCVKYSLYHPTGYHLAFPFYN